MLTGILAKDEIAGDPGEAVWGLLVVPGCKCPAAEAATLTAASP